MFKTINKKIKWSIILFLIIFIIIESILSIISISRIIYNNFQSFTEEGVELNIDNCDFLLSLATHATDIVVKDENFLAKVKQREYFLSSLKLSSLSIIGITLYDTNGNRYFSDGMSGVLTLSQILENQEIKYFYENNEQDYYFSIRKSSIHAVYSNNQLYDERQGIISYINKLYDANNNVVGYLFVDFSPRYLYNNFFSFTNDPDLNDSISFITFDGNNYLETTNNKEYESYLDERIENKTIVSKDKKFIIVSKEFNTIGADLVILIPTLTYIQKIAIIIGPIILLSILFITFSIIIGGRTSSKVVKQLTSLNNKMLDAEKYI